MQLAAISPAEISHGYPSSREIAHTIQTLSLISGSAELIAIAFADNRTDEPNFSVMQRG